MPDLRQIRLGFFENFFLCFNLRCKVANFLADFLKLFNGSMNDPSDKVAKRLTPISMPIADVDLCVISGVSYST